MDIKIRLTSLFGKSDSYQKDYKRFKKALEFNPKDHGLQAQFINFCLLNRFTQHEPAPHHIAEALALFEAIDPKESFDLQCHYLVGKYYQEEKDIRKAYQVYLNAIKLFNRYIGMDPNLKADNAELAYSMALNVMTLQAQPVDPELERCFKILRKSYPLHLKRIELDNELAKPVPDKTKVQHLKEEIHRLKEDEELIASVTTTERKSKKLDPHLEDKETRKHIRDSQPMDKTRTSHRGKKEEEGTPEILDEEKENLDFLKLSPLSEPAPKDTSFMVYKNDRWEGPYTSSQLRAMRILKKDTWVCREGSQHVTQAYEVPDLSSLFKH